MTQDAQTLVALLKEKQPLAAMVAPSFPIMYKENELIAKLRGIGFTYILEVAAGAKRTNEAVVKALRDDPNARFITSPCPSFVRFVRTKYPQYEKYLAEQVDSPMIATARIAQETYPGYRPVFIGPCNVKKLESSQDYPELNILVVTYKELEEVFAELQALSGEPGNNAFDVSEISTRIYPYDGGLTDSSGVRDILSDEEIRIVSGWKACEEALKEFETNPKIRLVDILFCEGGCINGPGVVSTLSLEDRKKKIQEYYTMSKLRQYASPQSVLE
ncbi:hypothetical protein IPM65_02160 [Candidatus Roizmanbacteria bacterium]|nr:MAG: hypothetical protein IPM65_02160 [Candidatus Roizmanbacteria bacterium]